MCNFHFFFKWDVSCSFFNPNHAIISRRRCITTNSKISLQQEDLLLARRPGHLAATQHVKMKVKYLLAALGAVVHHHAEPLQALFLGHAARHQHQVPQQAHVVLRGIAQLGEPLALLGDDQEVRGRRRVDVAERQALIILVKHICWDFFCDNLVKDCGWGVVTKTRTEDGVPTAGSLPAVQRPEYLGVDPHGHRLGRRHVLPPPFQLGPEERVRFVPELRQHEGEEDAGGEDRRVRERELRPRQVGAGLRDQALHDAQLAHYLAHGLGARRQAPVRGRLVQRPLDRLKVAVVPTGQDACQRVLLDVGRHEGGGAVGVRVQQPPGNRVRLWDCFTSLIYDQQWHFPCRMKLHELFRLEASKISRRANLYCILEPFLINYEPATGTVI
mmetsp:Transcript_27087/g.42515  ORF Transcript_27087/g.42515 Transcript_27087/m.42515 type:complete len:386 (-) Transcript_27087:128-1285(-)